MICSKNSFTIQELLFLILNQGIPESISRNYTVANFFFVFITLAFRKCDFSVITNL